MSKASYFQDIKQVPIFLAVCFLCGSILFVGFSICLYPIFSKNDMSVYFGSPAWDTVDIVDTLGSTLLLGENGGNYKFVQVEKGPLFERSRIVRYFDVTSDSVNGAVRDYYSLFSFEADANKIRITREEPSGRRVGTLVQFLLAGFVLACGMLSACTISSRFHNAL